MGEKQVTLETKTGWKIYQVVVGLLTIACIAFLINRLIYILKYEPTSGIFLIAFFSLMIVGVLYSLVHSLRHQVIFDESSMRRIGIMKEKMIPYTEIDELRFTDSFWKSGPASSLFWGKNTYVIDIKYKDADLAKSFLKDVLKLDDRINFVEN